MSAARQKIYQLCSILLSVLAGTLLLNDVILGFRTHVAKHTLILTSALIFLLSLLLILLFLYGYRNRNRYPIHTQINYIISWRGLLPLLSVLLFLYQISTGYVIRFVSETWDEAKVLQSALPAAAGLPGFIEQNYFSRFPNNQGILLLETLLFRLTNVRTMEGAVIVGLILQSLLSVASAALLFRVVYHQTKSRNWAVFSWVFYVLLFGISGWTVVLYTDMTALIFPIFIFRLTQILEDRPLRFWQRCGLYAAIIMLLFAGYKLKPTVAIIGIAIVLSALVKLLFSRKDLPIQELATRCLAVILLSAVLLPTMNFSFDAAVSRIGVVVDEEKNTGPLHMLMMGMNAENDGAIYIDDVIFSVEIPTREARKAAQIERIKSRLKSYGVGGFLSFMSKKSLLDYNDGTFAWGDEAGFFDVKFADNAGGIFGKVVRAYLYTDGTLYPLTMFFFQILWYAALFLLALSFLQDPKKMNTATLSAQLSVIGILVFNLLFEARARYLIVYIPLILFVATENLRALAEVYVRESAKSSPVKNATAQPTPATTPSPKPRLDTFDVAKGIAFFVVVWGHFLSPYGTIPAYTFNLPLFFVVSGYFLSRRKSVDVFIKEKAKQLLVPYLITGALLLTVKTLTPLISGEGSSEMKLAFLTELKSLIYGAGLDTESALPFFSNTPFVGPIWFLLALFFAFCIVRIALEFRFGFLIVGLCAAIGYFSAPVLWLPFSFQTGLMLSSYVYVGYLVKCLIARLQKDVSPSYIFYTAMLAMFAIVCYFYLQGEETSILFCINVFPRGIVDVLGPFTSIFTVILFSHLGVRKTPVLKTWFRFIGQNTLFMLCVHTLDTMLLSWGFIFNNLGVGVEVLFLVQMLKMTAYCLLTVGWLALKKRMKQ